MFKNNRNFTDQTGDKSLPPMAYAIFIAILIAAPFLI